MGCASSSDFAREAGECATADPALYNACLAKLPEVRDLRDRVALLERDLDRAGRAAMTTGLLKLHSQLGAGMPDVVPQFHRTDPAVRKLFREQMVLLHGEAIGFQPLGEHGALEALMDKVAHSALPPIERCEMFVDGCCGQDFILRHLGADTLFTLTSATVFSDGDTSDRKAYSSEAHSARGRREEKNVKDVCVYIKHSWAHGHCVLYFKCGSIVIGFTGASIWSPGGAFGAPAAGAFGAPAAGAFGAAPAAGAFGGAWEHLASVGEARISAFTKISSLFYAQDGAPIDGAGETEEEVVSLQSGRFDKLPRTHVFETAH